jgi:hypothetical protein
MKLTVFGLVALVLVSLTGPALAAPISGAAVRTADGPPLTLDSIQAP